MKVNGKKDWTCLPAGMWATEMKTLLMHALKLKKQLTVQQYYGVNHGRENIQKRLLELLSASLDPIYQKAKTFQKSLLKHQQYVLFFLYRPKISPDNNGSERAIRNVKVKQKISGQFKFDEGADAFVILRSVIDTTIKFRQNVLQALSLIAKLRTK